MDGTLTVTGGSIFTSVTANSMMVNGIDFTPSLGDISKELNASLANNQISPVSITGFAFDNTIVRSFDAIASLELDDGSGLKCAHYNLRGVQKGTGTWVLNSTYVGDSIGVTFSINSSGEIQYISTNVAGFVSNIIKFRAMTTSV